MNLIYTHLQLICIGKYLRTEITQTNIKSGEIFKKKNINDHSTIVYGSGQLSDSGKLASFILYQFILPIAKYIIWE